MTDTMLTHTALTEAAEKAGVTTDQARTILEAAGVTVQPEKPGPGTWHFTEGYMAPAPEVPAYVSKAGDLYLVHSDGRVEGFAGGSDAWPALTPARVVPVTAAPVTLTEGQVGEEWDKVSVPMVAWRVLGSRNRERITATVNAALAQHAAPAEGEPIDPNDVRAGDRVRVVLEGGDEGTFTVTHIGESRLGSRQSVCLKRYIRSVRLLHREEA